MSSGATPQDVRDGELYGYKYTELPTTSQHIRLVTLRPGCWADGIVCTIQITRLDTKPSYEALSYVWGDPRGRKTIQLNGHAFDVTENLWLALRRLRHPSAPCVLWIDAICINQNKDKEKSQQVAMMGDIYKACTHCTIWLGESLGSIEADDAPPDTGSATTSRARELLGVLSVDKHLPELPCFLTIEGERTDISIEYEAHFEALAKLLELPWWRRIWVVQELVLPPSVKFLWGSEEIPYEALKGAVDMLKTHAATCCKSHRMSLRAMAFDPLLTLQEQVDPMISTRETWKSGNPLSLFQLRRQFYASQATDKRDLFYGLLGLVTQWGPHSPLMPNYVISLREAVTEAVFKCVEEQGGAEVLLGERLFRPQRSSTDTSNLPASTEELPTWVPDASFCSVPSQWVMVERRRLVMYSYFSASEPFSQDASRLKMINGVLFAQSLSVGKIAKIGPMCDALENWYKAPDVFRHWMEMVGIGFGWPEQPPAQGSLMDIFWRTMVNDLIEVDDTTILSYRKPTAEDYSELQRHWTLLFQASGLASTIGLSLSPDLFDTLMSQASKTVYHVFVCIWHRCLFITEDGMLGLAPEHARVGDEVHVLLGSPAPFILRRVEGPATAGAGSTPCYSVVGNGFAHGIMNGEAFQSNTEVEEGYGVKAVAIV